MQKIDTYEEAVEFVLSIPKFASKIGTDNLKRLLREFNHPECEVPAIHVAGTNGKGSTCEFMRCILQEAGYQVGMFTSPHLIKINERIQINGVCISDEEFYQVFSIVHHRLLEITNLECRENDLPYPSFFEMLFLLAAVYFQMKHIDVVIYETGMGGRLDATNVIVPIVSVITSVGMDHMQYLGNTLLEIAGEKAGIIKENIPIISFIRDETVENLLREKAKQCHAPFVAVEKRDYVLDKITAKNIDFSINSEYYKCDALQIKKTALYQVENAVLAVVALSKTSLRIRELHIKRGLQKMAWAGRMEEILPEVYIDGAHNEEAILLWKETVQTFFPDKHCSLLFAVANDKDYSAMIAHICDNMRYDTIYVTTIPGTRQTAVSLVKEQFEAQTKDKIIVIEDTETAFYKAIEEKEDDEYIFLVGSLYLVGAVKQALNEKGD